MRIQISHTTAYRYARPAKGVIQTLRLTPRNNAAQHVTRWRAEIDADARMRQGEDAFGNIVHSLNAAGPIDAFSIHVEGEVETRDTAGVLTGAVERFPAELYLRATDLTAVNPGMADYARDAQDSCGAQSGDMLAVMHGLMSALGRDMTFDAEPTDSTTKAADAFAAKRGVCQDYAHIFCAMARSLGVPARYVSGYFHRADNVVDQNAGHAWAEVHIKGLGWVGFDAANAICTTDAHVRVASALDYLGAAPVRGSRLGGNDEFLSVAVKVTQLQIQS
ncbi:transglutaminase family protein [Terrarubrum flagellatum]|uniref:transglutaminase family protein n=1 Tax=Terrirubrum flagellatum TaxID=2895980 RepID=UPI003144E076